MQLYSLVWIQKYAAGFSAVLLAILACLSGVLDVKVGSWVLSFHVTWSEGCDQRLSIERELSWAKKAKHIAISDCNG